MVIPYYDQNGTIIGLVGRNIRHDPDKGIAKYMYTKGLVRNGTLLNIHNIDRTRELIVVEGVLDYLHAKACGIDNIIALGGTGFSHRQAELLKFLGINKITLCLDSDKAGQDATNRIASLIFDKHPDAEVKIARLPAGVKDFDEMLKSKGGVDKALEIIEKAKIQDKEECEAVRSNAITQEITQNKAQKLVL